VNLIRSWKLDWIVGVLAMLPASAVFSQPTAEPLEEIVVTANFRQADPRDVPTSLVVLDQTTVQQASVQHFEELSLLVPNLNYSGEGNRAQYFQIRGVGELAQYEGAPNPSVGFIVDDIDFSALGGIATLFDVEQVEVLRGPQGTRYGANALAGLVYVTTAAPPESVELDAELTLAENNARGVGLSLGGPLNDTLAGRLSVHQYQSDGFRSNPFLGRNDTHGRDETTLRGKLKWQPTDDFSGQLTLFYFDVDDGYDAFALDNGFTTYSDKPGRDAQRSLAGALRLSQQWDRLELTSISSVAKSDITFSFDADWGNDDFWAPFQYDFLTATSRDRETVSQELRLASVPGEGLAGGTIEWLLGFYAFKLREANATQEVGTYIDPAAPQFPFLLDSNVQRTYEATNLAAFADVQWSVAENWLLAGGLRLEGRNADYRDPANQFSPSESMLGGQLTLTRQFAGGTNLYGRLARGYKAGGFNLGVPPGDPRSLFEVEYLWNYELGLKMGGDVLSGDIAIFFSERDDQQVETTTQLDPNNPTSFVFFTSNAGEGYNRGVEASVRWKVNPRWKLEGALGLLRTKVENFGGNTALAGRDQAHAPEFSYHLGLIYNHPSGWFGRLDVAGQDQAFIDYFEPGFGTDPQFCNSQQLPDYQLINARVGYQRARWSAVLWARNAFDETFATRGFCFGNEPPAFPETLYLKQGDPRQIGITLRAKF
jgi:iron complex outermembrane receptor protein